MTPRTHVKSWPRLRVPYSCHAMRRKKAGSLGLASHQPGSRGQMPAPPAAHSSSSDDFISDVRDCGGPMHLTMVLLPFLHFLSTSFQNRLLGFISCYAVFVRNMKCPPQAARVGACLPAEGIWGSNHIHRSLAQLRNWLPDEIICWHY